MSRAADALAAPLREPLVPPTDTADDGSRAVLGPLPAWSAEGLGALALVVSLPPWGVWPLAVLAPPLFVVGALAARSGWVAWGRASLAGFLLVMLGAHWIAETAFVSLLFVAVVVGPVFGVVGPLARACLARGPLFPTLPLLWVAVEALRHHWPDVGFAWLLVGHALAAQPLLVQVADLGGVLAVSLVGACAGTALLAWRTRRRGALPSLVVLLAALVYGAVRPSTLPAPDEGPLLVSIQPGFPQELKEQEDRRAERWAVCRDLALQAAAEHPDADLLVFPETMWPGGTLEDARRDPPGPAFAPSAAPGDDGLAAALAENAAADAARLAELLRAFPGATSALIGTTLVGFADLENPPAYTENAVLLLDPAGRERGRYSKHILIPGGEKLPLVDMLPAFMGVWIERLVTSIAHFTPDLRPGPGPRLLRLDARDGAHDFGVTICFENAYGDYTRRFVGGGARFLVNLSNEGWFDTSAEFDHMQLQSVLRTVETRRALFRSTNTGISSLVRPDGRVPEAPDSLVVGGRDRAVSGVFAARVPLHPGTTLYTRVGDAWAWLAAGWVIVTSLVRLRQRRGSRAAPGTGARLP